MMMDRRAEAKMYADHYHYEPQQEGEDDNAFSERVANELRHDGHIIEAHELQSGQLWDDPAGQALTGITGAVANAMYRPGHESLGEDIAAGVIVQAPKKPEIPVELLLALISAMR
jgi:hypothetical protein